MEGRQTIKTAAGRIAELIAAVYNSTLPTLTDGQKTELQTDNRGRLITTTAGGTVAHDAVDSGNPEKIGGKAESTEPAAVADGDRVDAYFDLQGRLVVRTKSRTPTVTSVPDQATNVTLLALNAARLGASIVNESTSILYVKCGATATTSSYTIALGPDGSGRLLLRGAVRLHRDHRRHLVG
jgi:hypothetical protein